MGKQFASAASIRIAAVIAVCAVGCGDNAAQTNGFGTGGISAGGSPGIGAGGGSGVGATAGVGAAGMPAAGTGSMMPPVAGMMATAGMSGAAGTGMGGTGTSGMSGGMSGMGGTSGGMSGMGGGGAPTSGSCLPTDNVDADGPYTPTHIQNGGPSGTSWVFYPEELGMNGMKHAVFNWGPGAGTGPSQYTDHLNRLASHGFVVISQPSSGNGNTEKAALDWLLAENDMQGSDFYQKLDPMKVGAGGHSLGALTTMAMAADPRLTMYVLVCGGCMSGNGGCGAADIHGPTVILGGDTDIGTPNFDGDYDEITTPVAFVIKDGTDHIACARNNLAPWVAFMRWQFCGEEQYKADFMMGGKYCTSPWECKSKGL